MCIFAGSVERVSKTQIIVAPLSDGRQFTAYSNSVVSRSSKNAMILPVPAGKVEFVNLDGVMDLMKACEALFPRRPEDMVAAAGNFSFGAGFGSKNVLPTEKVGGYTCSVVPSLDDFDRIDQNVFVLPKNTAELLKKTYPEGYSFIVCQFGQKVSAHPIAYTHVMHSSGKLFIPTFHGHDGEKAGTPKFSEVDFGYGPRDNFIYAGGTPNFEENDARRRRNNNNNNNRRYPSDWSARGDFAPPPASSGDNSFFVGSARRDDEVDGSNAIHNGITCDICGESPLTGTRYKCMQCADFDACKGCRRQHNKSHVFAEFVFEADRNKLWQSPVWSESVYLNEGGTKSFEEYDHTIYILNGMCNQNVEEYTELRNEIINHEGNTLRTLLAGLGVPVDVFMAQKLNIQGRFLNRDYSASVLLRK